MPPLRSRHASSRVLPKLCIDSDNEAQQAWRHGNKHADTYRLTRGLDLLQDDSSALQAIAFSTQTHLYPRPSHSHRGAVDILIWGNPAQCVAVRARIEAWVEQARLKGKSRAKYAKTVGFTPEKEALALARLEAETNRLKYKKYPNQGQLSRGFKYMFLLTWPKTQPVPEDAFGLSLEALDPIRMDCHCYIEFRRTEEMSGGPCFVLYGNKEKGISRALERLQTFDLQQKARTFEHLQCFVVKSLELPVDYNNYAIRQMPYKQSGHENGGPLNTESSGDVVMKLQKRQSREPDFLGPTEMFAWNLNDLESGVTLFGANNAKRLNQQYFEFWTITALEYLPYYRGYLKMRASLGSCVFTKYLLAKDKDRTYSLRTFETMLRDRNMQDSEMQAYFTTELGDERTEIDLLNGFFASKDFTFQDSPYLGAPAKKCHPQYAAIFLIEGSAKVPTYRLEVEFKEDGNGDIYRQHLQWLRLDPAEKDLTRMVDINLIDVENSSTSYNLNISGCHHVLGASGEAKLPASYTQFANSIALNLEAAKRPGRGEKFVKFDSVGKSIMLPVYQIEQRRLWRFNIRDAPGYVAEVFTTQTVECDKGVQTKVGRERWGVQIWHAQWDLHFNENKSLEIGERTSWVPEEWQFFTSGLACSSEDLEGVEYERGSGFAKLMKVLELVENVVKSVTPMQDAGFENSTPLLSSALPAEKNPPGDDSPTWITQKSSSLDDLLTPIDMTPDTASTIARLSNIQPRQSGDDTRSSQTLQYQTSEHSIHMKAPRPRKVAPFIPENTHHRQHHSTSQPNQHHTLKAEPTRNPNENTKPPKNRSLVQTTTQGKNGVVFGGNTMGSGSGSGSGRGGSNGMIGGSMYDLLGEEEV